MEESLEKTWLEPTLADSIPGFVLLCTTPPLDVNRTTFAEERVKDERAV